MRDRGGGSKTGKKIRWDGVWKGGVWLIGSNKVWVARARPFTRSRARTRSCISRVYDNGELSDRQPDYWSIRTCLITHGPNGLRSSDSNAALRIAFDATEDICRSTANALLFFRLAVFRPSENKRSHKMPDFVSLFG